MSRLPMPITFLCVLLSLSNFGGGGVPVVDGFDLKEPENPYRSFFARLVVTFKGQSEPITCGGAVIHPYWVLTAAHCVANATMIDAIVGDFTSDNGNRSSIIGVEAFWPEYFNELADYYHDMGLVLLQEPLSSESVISICYEEFPGRTLLSIIGLGRQPDSSSLQLQEIRTVEKKLWSNFLRLFNLRDDMFNAKMYKGSGICYAETGGPLVIIDVHSYEAICVYGVASKFKMKTDHECLKFEFYSSVPDLHAWIEDVMASRLST